MILWGVIVAALLSMAASEERQEQMSEDEFARRVYMEHTLGGKPPGLVLVQLGLTVTSITELNEEQGYMEMTGWLYKAWNDSRFVIPDGEVSVPPNSAFRFDIENVWVPDIELYTAVSTGYKLLNHNLKAAVFPDGNLILVEMFTARSQCDVNGQLTMGNTVQCSMKFGSWAYSGFHVDLQLSNEQVDVSEFRPSGLWTLENTSQKRNVKNYACCPEPYVDVTFNLTFTKRSTRGSWW